MAYHPVPDGSQQVLYAMVGVLGTAWVAVINYYFGSSAGSAAKTDALVQQIQQKK
jgi:hypothetical protein